MITVQLARVYLAAAHPDVPTPTSSTIYTWLWRGNVKRAEDGGIDLASLDQWFTESRNMRQAMRRTPRLVAK